ncbi:MAG: hypothetical protein K8S94_14630 [Planctomycetia bacterium]|nr:hypothetical protein [Planctomycetia bacterium]
MQDAVAIAVAIAACVWLARTLWRQLLAPGCGKPANPAGADGFIPLDRLTKQKPGRSAERPGR